MGMLLLSQRVKLSPMPTLQEFTSILNCQKHQEQTVMVP